MVSLADVPATETAEGSEKRSLVIKAYASGWRDFLSVCQTRGVPALPASDETVALYLSDTAGRGAKAATIAGRLVVVSQAHTGADLSSWRPAHGA